jgi:hypothetical protein
MSLYTPWAIFATAQLGGLGSTRSALRYNALPIAHLLVERVEISERGADITLRLDGLATVLNDMRAAGQQGAA